MAAKVTKVVVLGVQVGRHGGNVQNCVVVSVKTRTIYSYMYMNLQLNIAKLFDFVMKSVK